MEVGIWRSRLGDTHPHRDVDVDLDYWPQGTNVVSADPAMVLCASGAGGGSQQAMFRTDLEPLLGRAVARWKAGPGGALRARVEALFASIQREFEAQRTPAWADQFHASAVAVVVDAGRCAIANVGVERAWLLRDGGFARVSKDDVLTEDPEAPLWMQQASASWFSRQGGEPAHWHTCEIALREGDVVLLASGTRDTGLDDAALGAALARVLAASGTLVEAAAGLGAYVAAVEHRIVASDDRRSAKWRVHSRAALAIVRPG
jgi:hypothetical protein